MPARPSRHWFGPLLAGGLCLGTGYLAFALVGSEVAPAIFWPPAGIALGAALVWGWRVLPWVLLGTAVAAVLWQAHWQGALLLGLAASVQAVVGAALLRRLGFPGRLAKLADLLKLFVAGGLLAGLAASAPTYFALSGTDWFWEASTLRAAVAVGFSHLLGTMVFAPLLICRPTADCPRPLGHAWEAPAALLFLLLSALVLAHPSLLGQPPGVFRPYPLLPILLWLALRARPWDTALGIATVYAVAASSIRWGADSLFLLLPDEKLFPIHGFVFVLALTFMALAVLMLSRALAENALRASEARLRNVIGLIRNCLWETDAEGRFAFLDSHVESVFALSAKSMLGRRPEEIWPETLGPTLARLFRDTLDRGEARCESHSYRQPDGAIAYLETNCAPLRDGEGRHLGWQGITREVSERVRIARDLEESLQRFRQLAANIQEVFWIVENGTRFVYVSPQCMEVIGIEPARLDADPLAWRSVVHPADLGAVDEAWRKMCAGEPVDLEFRILHPSKRERWVWARAMPFDDPRGARMSAGILEDATERKRAERAHLEQALAYKDVLIREVHHRIKNNLQTVVGLLRREAGKHPEATDAIEAAIAQVQSVAVVHGLHGRLAQPTIMLCELLPAIVDSTAALSGVTIALDGPREGCGELVILDSETVAVALILNELISNAVKHAAPGSDGPPAAQHTRVSMRRDGHAARVRIVNPGALPAGFDFRRGRGLGTGLGLVRALRPDPGMEIAFRQDGARVEVEVLIREPVLYAARTDQLEFSGSKRDVPGASPG
ncbi:MAG: PAS domain S-box protein [Betaproteobacteria bacterium]|nr:PAS domain S-box protein [Betaproteobacteria bacterium]